MCAVFVNSYQYSHLKPVTTRKTNLFNILILHTGVLNVVQEGGSSMSSSRLLLCGVTCDGAGGGVALAMISLRV